MPATLRWIGLTARVEEGQRTSANQWFVEMLNNRRDFHWPTGPSAAEPDWDSILAHEAAAFLGDGAEVEAEPEEDTGSLDGVAY